MPRRLLVVAVGVAFVAVAAVGFATQAGTAKTGSRLRVSIVLAHPTIHAGTTDPIAIVNDTGYWIGYGGCTVVSPRTSPRFKLPHGWVSCLANTPIAPHSRYRLLMTANEDPIAAEPPGRYWVWLAYWRRGRSAPEYTAHTKLTVVS